MRPDLIPNRQEFSETLTAVRPKLLSLVHFRVPHQKPHRFDHVAVAVTKDGFCYHADARLSNKDQYNRKRGFTISVARALLEAARGIEPSFRLILPAETSDKDIRLAVFKYFKEQEN